MNEPNQSDPTQPGPLPAPYRQIARAQQPQHPFGSEEPTTEVPWWRQVNRRIPAQPRRADPRQGPTQRPPQVSPSTPRPTPRVRPPTMSHAAPGILPPQREPEGADQSRQRAQEPDQYSQPRPFRPAGSADGVRRARSKRRLLVAAGVVVVVIEAIILTVVVSMLGLFDRKELDINKAQAGVQQILTDPIRGYGAKNVTDVACNNGQNPSGEKGDSFTCQVTVNGIRRHVTVVVDDDNGSYKVDRPR